MVSSSGKPFSNGCNSFTVFIGKSSVRFCLQLSSYWRHEYLMINKDQHVLIFLMEAEKRWPLKNRIPTWYAVRKRGRSVVSYIRSIFCYDETTSILMMLINMKKKERKKKEWKEEHKEFNDLCKQRCWFLRFWC